MNPFDYRHEVVRKLFEQKAQQELKCLNNTRFQPMQSVLIEDWLNDYTTLLNLWFCELLYFPTMTDNEQWALKIVEKVQTPTRMSISEIINHFKLNTIQQNGQQLYIEDILTHQLNQYMGYHNNYQGEALLEQTLGGGRGNLTFRILGKIKSENKNLLNTTLKQQYPTDKSISFEEAYAKSYHPIVRAEEDRERLITEMLSRFDLDTIRPLLIEKGYVPVDE